MPSAVTTAAANGIELAYETFGNPDDPTILLVMGLGAQMVMWEQGVCDLLVEAGHHVVRFDNRDVGQSTWIDTPGLDIGAAALAALMGDRSQAPYLLSDMAADAIGLLDHLEVDSAHVVGASMGGMIAQTMAIEHPDRLRSLTSIMSTTGEPGVGEPTSEMTEALLAPRPTEREAAIEAGVAIARAISSPDHFDEARARALAAVQYDRGHNPDGVGRQLVAVLASGSRAEGLAGLDLPALVIHGRQDQLVTFSGGERTAELIEGAELLAIDDMGHDMAEVHWPRAVAAITELTTRAG